MAHSSEAVRLFVDPHWVSGGADTMAASWMGVDHKLLEDVARGKQSVLEYAGKLGISVVIAEPEEQGPEDYIVRGRPLTREQEEAELREAVPEVLIPTTQSFEDYSANPYFPVLAKMKESALGMYKYLLEEPNQWEKLRTFLTGDGDLLKVSEEDRQAYQSVLDQLAAAQGTPRAGDMETYKAEWDDYIRRVKNPLPESMRNYLRNKFEFQKFVETPSERYTSYRVLVTANGTVLASSLYYSGITGSEGTLTKNQTLEELGMPGNDLTDFLVTPGSLVYLGARNVLSNQNQGGRGIVLNPNDSSKPIVTEDRAILEAHGLDTNNPQLPDTIHEQSKLIGRSLGRRRGVLVGIDWLQEVGSGKFYYLETNSGPGAVAYADAYLGGADNLSMVDANVTMQKAALETLNR